MLEENDPLMFIAIEWLKMPLSELVRYGKRMNDRAWTVQVDLLQILEF